MRGKILFDSIDQDILILCKWHKGFQVLKIVDILQISHKNLKPHLDRLVNNNLMYIKKNKIEKIYITSKKGNDFLDLLPFENNKIIEDKQNE